MSGADLWLHSCSLTPLPSNCVESVRVPPRPGSSRLSTLRCRYRLAGLPGEHQQRNITSPEVNYCLVTELIIWTQYEIQVAAYNGAGLGVFSRAVTEYTLLGGKLAFPRGCTVSVGEQGASSLTRARWKKDERGAWAAQSVEP